jgi:N-acetylglucosaminyldiphosphoundecaprenol N-acetyl-beta-D-mannosaminyltransferase
LARVFLVTETDAPQGVAHVPTRPTVELLGTSLALTDYDGVCEWIDEMVAADARGYVCVAATHTLMASREDSQLRAAVDGASFTVADGRPIVWGLALLGHRLPDRIYGPELMLHACRKAESSGHKFFLYGGRSPEALARLQQTLEAEHPALEIVGAHSPPFRPLTKTEQADLIKEINSSGADVVWVGIGVPKQEYWMADMRPHLAAPVLLGVGAAFDFHAGLIAQAPRWMQRCGLEWLFRLSREPRRLWRRYARYNPRFVLSLGVELCRRRVLHRAR